MDNLELSSEQIAALGQEVYSTTIRNRVEPAQNGRYLALDIHTSEYEVADEMLAAIDQLKARHPDATVYVLRIGFASTVKLGSKMRVAGE